nr:arginyltransferase [Gammaproteobacteria bacterium]
EASTVFVDPEVIPSIDLLSELSEIGFRRSGPHVYRPDCGSCNACVSVRIPTAAFSPNRRFKRVLTRNQDVTITTTLSIATNPNARALYERYVNTRHQDGDMYPASQEQFDSFIVSPSESTRFFLFTVGTKLIAVTVCDELRQGLSAVYTFFDPDESKRSPGTFAILSLIAHAHQKQLPYVFLGYWVKDCRKMEYKLDFRPIELLQDKRWIRIS